MSLINSPTRDFDRLAHDVRAVISAAEAIPITAPNVARARVRALALLWALHDELEASARALEARALGPAASPRPRP